MATSTYARPASIELTEIPEANQLLGQDPAAFLIGWICDQQIKVQQAFAAPYLLQQRIGSIEPAFIAGMAEDDFIAAFRDKPALHRYGNAVGKRVRDCMQTIVDEYDGDAENVWLDVTSYDELRKRITKLPGFGTGKAPAVCAMLANRFGLPIRGFKKDLMSYGSLADVEVYEDLLAYQERKGAYKAKLKAKAERAAKK